MIEGTVSFLTLLLHSAHQPHSPTSPAASHPFGESGRQARAKASQMGLVLPGSGLGWTRRCPFAFFLSLLLVSFPATYTHRRSGVPTRLISLLPAERFCSGIHFAPVPCSFPQPCHLDHRHLHLSGAPRAQVPLEFAPYIMVGASYLAGICEMHILGLRLLAFLGWSILTPPIRSSPTPLLSPVSTVDGALVWPASHVCSRSLPIAYAGQGQFLGL